MKEKKVVKRKLSIKGLIVVLLGAYLIIMGLFAIYKMPITNIIIEGNTLTLDKEILQVIDLKVKDSLWKVNKGKIKKKVTNLDLISDVKVTRNLLGKVIIKVKEEKVLFFNTNTNKYVLGNGEEIELKEKVYGVPTLINYVASNTLEAFIKALAKIDTSIINMISEIEYDPDIKDNITIDDGRFLLKMNDENMVYINIVNLEKLDNYKVFVATLTANAKGVMYLDSNFDGALFKTYDKIKEEKAKEIEGEINDGTTSN